MSRYSDHVLVVFAASMIAVGAWLRFSVGPVPYTLQNFGVVIASLLLDPARAASSVLLYIAMIAVGLPVAAGFTGGPHVLFGYTAGYIWGFLVSAPLVSTLARAYLRAYRRCALDLRPRDVALLTALASVGMLPTYLMGYAVFRHYALASPGLLNWASSASRLFGIQGGPELAVLVAAVAIFLPQDAMMDHFLAAAAFRGLCLLLLSRGVVSGSCGRCG